MQPLWVCFEAIGFYSGFTKKLCHWTVGNNYFPYSAQIEVPGRRKAVLDTCRNTYHSTLISTTLKVRVSTSSLFMPSHILVVPIPVTTKLPCCPLALPSSWWIFLLSGEFLVILLCLTTLKCVVLWRSSREPSNHLNI